MKHVALAALLLLVPLQAAALDTEELLGLVAMPLAVAAVSNVTGVPVEDLSNLVASLNRADVPPTQVVQVVRYAPVALVVQTSQPSFVQFVDQQVDSGIRGTQLVTVIDQRLRTYDITPQIMTLTEPAPVFVTSERFLVTRPPVVVNTPRVVTDRRTVEPARAHPHGGPPGQIKKQIGVQTGAEVVHSASRAPKPKHDDNSHGKGHGNGNGKGQDKGKGKGKG